MEKACSSAPGDGRLPPLRLAQGPVRGHRGIHTRPTPPFPGPQFLRVEELDIEQRGGLADPIEQPRLLRLGQVADAAAQGIDVGGVAGVDAGELADQQARAPGKALQGTAQLGQLDVAGIVDARLDLVQHPDQDRLLGVLQVSRTLAAQVLLALGLFPGCPCPAGSSMRDLISAR